MRTVCVTAVAGAVLALTFRAAADDKKPAFDPKAVEAAMMKAGAVTEHHKKLEPLVGSFDYTVKFWMDPSKPPEESKGTCEARWVMGGRFVQQEIKGDFNGVPFHGVGLVGYDNLQQKYVSSWIDNMSTAIMASTGELARDGKAIHFAGEENCPIVGQKIKVRNVIPLVAGVPSVYYRTVGGEEMKGMEITYTRKK